MRLSIAVFVGALISLGCFSPVEQRWCDVQSPCTAGFECVSFHCVPTTGSSTGGGAAGGGRATGGGSPLGGGGGGIPLGGGKPIGGGAPLGGGTGGGGTLCDAMSCPKGCCLFGACVDTPFQNDRACGLFGDQCVACGPSEACQGGKCFPAIFTDGGKPGVVGGPCRSDSECGTSATVFCIPEFSQGMPTGFAGGYCSQTCENGPCPGAAACVEADNGNNSIIHICLSSCMTTQQCRMGYQCDQGVCLP